jgi:hypothetical protein
MDKNRHDSKPDQENDEQLVCLTLLTSSGLRQKVKTKKPSRKEPSSIGCYTRETDASSVGGSFTGWLDNFVKSISPLTELHPLRFFYGVDFLLLVGTTLCHPHATPIFLYTYIIKFIPSQMDDVSLRQSLAAF